MDRRRFVELGGVAALAAASLRVNASQANSSRPLFVATWDFGLPACKQSLKTLQAGGSILDAVEQGIKVAEADPKVDSVGVGGGPNADGVVQLDACIMDGRNQKAGSVAGLENYPHPISVARRVMEKTRHVMLVGAGAAEFAKAQGFETAELLTQPQREKWLEWKKRQAAAAVNNPVIETLAATGSHDTIALVGVDAEGNLAGGCSTSGLTYKLPGRVGDSPILGSGLYVDGEIGAAGATGIGENIMRYCGSFLIVEMMRGGMDPASACRTVIERIARLERRPASDLHINFVAIDKQGRFGAAGTDESFQMAVVSSDVNRLDRPTLVK